LISDTYACEICASYAGSCQRRSATSQSSVPDLFGIVFDPAVVWEVLGKFLLSNAQLIAGGVKNQGAAAGGALVDCENVCAHAESL
jgi:hypothetical protein